MMVDSKLIEDNVIRIHSRSMSDPTLSDIDFKNKMHVSEANFTEIGLMGCQ